MERRMAFWGFCISACVKVQLVDETEGRESSVAFLCGRTLDHGYQDSKYLPQRQILHGSGQK